MGEYKISVIVPVYNAEKYIEKCVHSIRNQSLDGIEIILVNDGSTDNSPAILNEYSRIYNNVKVIHQENAKQGAARNAGLDIATGEYIIFVDSDDYLTCDRLGKMYNFCSKNRLDMYASSVICFDSNGNKTKEAVALLCKEDFICSGEEYITKYGYRIARGVVFYLYRRAFLEENGFRFTPCVYAEDTLFTMQCVSKAKRLAHRRYAHYAYVHNNNSSTKSYNASSEGMNAEEPCNARLFGILKIHMYGHITIPNM